MRTWRTTDLINLVANDDLDDVFGRICFKFIVPPGEGLEGLPIGYVVYCVIIGAFKPMYCIQTGRKNVPRMTPCALR